MITQQEIKDALLDADNGARLINSGRKGTIVIFDLPADEKNLNSSLYISRPVVEYDTINQTIEGVLVQNEMVDFEIIFPTSNELSEWDDILKIIQSLRDIKHFPEYTVNRDLVTQKIDTENGFVFINNFTMTRVVVTQ